MGLMGNLFGAGSGNRIETVTELRFSFTKGTANIARVTVSGILTNADGYKKVASQTVAVRTLPAQFQVAAVGIWKFLKDAIEAQSNLDPLPDPIVDQNTDFIPPVVP